MVTCARPSTPWLTGDHVKTAIIDKEIAFTGGMNIAREYRYDWHDLMTELRGPVVGVLQYEFEKAWAHAGFFGDLLATSQADAVAELERPIFEADFAESVELLHPFPERWTDHLLELVGDYVF